MAKPNILVVAGSTRNESLNRRLANEAVTLLASAGVDANLLDLRNYVLPLYDGDLEETQGRPEAVREMKEMARRADAFVVVSPEYNGSYPAVLKNAIDWISRPDSGERHLAVFRNKPTLVLSAAPGAHGGARVLRHLSDLLGMMGIPVVGTFGLANAATAFDDSGRLARQADIEALQTAARTLILAAEKVEKAA